MNIFFWMITRKSYEREFLSFLPFPVVFDDIVTKSCDRRCKRFFVLAYSDGDFIFPLTRDLLSSSRWSLYHVMLPHFYFCERNCIFVMSGLQEIFFHSIKRYSSSLFLFKTIHHIVSRAEFPLFIFFFSLLSRLFEYSLQNHLHVVVKNERSGELDDVKHRKSRDFWSTTENSLQASDKTRREREGEGETTGDELLRIWEKTRKDESR